MTLVSVYGLGFQLFIIALMLVLKLQAFIIPFFIGYSVLIIVFIFIRRIFLRAKGPILFLIDRYCTNHTTMK